MAYDLAPLPHTGINVQAIGDCHLMNFGAYATPERNLIFDANDFDETNPAPWEWDLKRLATSFILAARDRGFDKDFAQETARDVVKYYRDGMFENAEMNMLDLWYLRFEMDSIR